MAQSRGVATLVDTRDPERMQGARTWRRLAIGALTGLLVLALAGVLGIRSSSTTDAGAGWTLTVDHAVVTRAGVAVPFHVTVQRQGGIEGPFTLRISNELLERFDFQNWYPNPAKETSTREFLLYEFDPPPGDTFRLNLDARTAPDQNGSTEVYVVGLEVQGRLVAEVDFRMWITP